MPPAPNASTTLANASMTLASASALGIEYAAALPAAAGGGPPGASKREPERNFQANIDRLSKSINALSALQAAAGVHPENDDDPEQRPTLAYVCAFPGCSRPYRKSDGVRRHARKRHPEWLAERDQARPRKRPFTHQLVSAEVWDELRRQE